jgi:hemerythrin-like domain-containing protein
MTQATHVLKEEHRWIQLLLDCLDTLVRTSRAKDEFDVGAAQELQALFEHFVDQQHQEKEEEALFPKLLEAVQKLQDDHAAEREHLERMRFNLFNASLGDPAGREAFLSGAEAYLNLQRQHMAQESQGLLPLAEQLLSDQDDADVLAAFQRFEGKGLAREDVQKRLQGVCERLGVTFEEALGVG